MKTVTTAFVLVAVLSCAVGCGDLQQSDELSELKAQRDILEANKALVLRTHKEVWSNGNIDVIDELYSPEYIGHWVDGDDSDRNALKELVAEARAAFPDMTERVIHVVAEGDLVVTHFISSGTLIRETNGPQPTGRTISRPEIAIHRIANGKIIEQWTVYDQLTLMKQLGLE